MTIRRVVRERIDPRLTSALFSNYRTPVDAVLELVDNAVDSRVAGRPIELDLAVHPGRLVLVVVGGSGMSPGAIERDYLALPAAQRQGWRLPYLTLRRGILGEQAWLAWADEVALAARTGGGSTGDASHRRRWRRRTRAMTRAS